MLVLCFCHILLCISIVNPMVEVRKSCLQRQGSNTVIVSFVKSNAYSLNIFYQGTTMQETSSREAYRKVCPGLYMRTLHVMRVSTEIRHRLET